MEQGVKFETYASLRIRGAILDQIRKMDWIPRTIRQKQKKIETASKEVESRTGHAATDAEIAAELGITEEEMSDWQTDVNMTNVISLNEFVESGAEPAMETERNSHFIQPEEKISKDELKQKLTEALEVLTEKEKQVVLLYYYEEMTLKEISQILSVSESRVSQLHTKALGKMRNIMGDYLGLLTNM
jgi:RNA polymerase sigma factor for flagellar operon FliA